MITDCLNADTIFLETVGKVTHPTCTEKGYTTYTCIDCGYSYKDNYVDELGHEYDEKGECWRCALGDKITTYYVSENGNDNNIGSIASKPLATIDKAIQLALEWGAKKDDVIKVNITGNVRFGNTLITNHEFTLKLFSTSANATI
jgi:hypothetical protein